MESSDLPESSPLGACSALRVGARSASACWAAAAEVRRSRAAAGAVPVAPVKQQAAAGCAPEVVEVCRVVARVT